MLSQLLKSKAQRFFAVTLILFLSIAFAVAFKTEEKIEPSEYWYFFTTDGSQIDVQSPNGRMIIDAGFYPRWSTAVAFTAMRREFTARCDWQRRNPEPNPISAMHRGVMLCNTFNVSGDEFDIRVRHFKERVDSLYSSYYYELAEHYAKYIGAALALWLSLLIGWFTFKWVARGASPQV